MHIGFVTDEITSDVEEAIRIGTSWGIRHFELRMVRERRVPDIDPQQIDALLRLRDDYDVQFTALSPGIFKGKLGDREQLEHEMKSVLPETFRLAKTLGIELIIVFGFKREADDPLAHHGRVVLQLKEVALMAEDNGLVIAVENEPGFWCDSGENTARILRTVRSPALRANWDPANAIGTGQRPFPEGYASLKEWIANVHIKDTLRGALVESVPVGEGAVDWPGQLRALQHERLVDCITIETHCEPLLENSRKNLATVRRLLGRP